MKTIQITSLLMLLSGFSGLTGQTAQMKWCTPKELDVPESVLHDTKRNCLYVANIQGKSSEMDGQGFISKLNWEGGILVREWVKDLNAPKGMVLAQGHLFVSDVNALVEICPDRGLILNRYTAPDAKFLNDVTADKDGNVYVSDMQDQKIYILKEGQFSVWLKSEALASPNGLWVEGDVLLVGLRDRIVQVDLHSLEVKDYILNTGGIDGLVPDGNGSYLISDWAGSIHLVHPSRDKVKLLDTTAEKVNAADIDYVPEKKLLLVPTFFDHRVCGYKLE